MAQITAYHLFRYVCVLWHFCSLKLHTKWQVESCLLLCERWRSIAATRPTTTHWPRYYICIPHKQCPFGECILLIFVARVWAATASFVCCRFHVWRYHFVACICKYFCFFLCFAFFQHRAALCRAVMLRTQSDCMRYTIHSCILMFLCDFFATVCNCKIHTKSR